MGLVYEHISADQRAALGLAVALHHGAYGLVTGLARGLGTSRQFLYRLAARAQEAVAAALAPGTPGPQPAAPVVRVDRGRLDRAIVTLALVGHAPERAIADCLAELYGVRPSLGYVDGVLARASAAAAAVQARLRVPLPAGEVAADELFVGGRAQLGAVDPRSLLVLAATPAHTGGAPAAPGKAEAATAAAWERVFAGLCAGGAALHRVASDGGKALGAAVARLPGVEHQLDLWHVLRQVGRAERAAERAAYAAIKREYDLAGKARGMDRAHPMGGYVWGRYEAVRQRAAEAIRRYDDLCTVGQWAREALEAVDARTGRVRSRPEGVAELQAAAALLRGLGVPAADRLATALAGAGPGVLAYADRLQHDLAAAGRALGPRGEPGVGLLCAEWQQHRLAAKARAHARAARRLGAARAHLAALLHWGPDYPAARARVAAVLEGVLRGSSLVECVNSWLRPYADLLKGLGPRFLPLFQLYRNARVFPRGKRAGHSPLELAGVATPAGDWLAWLGLPRATRPPTRRVRALPPPPKL